MKLSALNRITFRTTEETSGFLGFFKKNIPITKETETNQIVKDIETYSEIISNCCNIKDLHARIRNNVKLAFIKFEDIIKKQGLEFKEVSSLAGKDSELSTTFKKIISIAGFEDSDIYEIVDDLVYIDILVVDDLYYTSGGGIAVFTTTKNDGVEDFEVKFHQMTKEEFEKTYLDF